jgi:hypothetical protein
VDIPEHIDPLVSEPVLVPSAYRYTKFSKSGTINPVWVAQVGAVYPTKSKRKNKKVIL